MTEYLGHNLIAHVRDYNKFICIKCKKYIYHNNYYSENYYCINNLTGDIKYKLILTCDEEIIKEIIE